MLLLIQINLTNMKTPGIFPRKGQVMTSRILRCFFLCVGTLTFLLAAPFARAQWDPVEGELDGRETTSVALHPESGRVFVGARGGVYASDEAGRSWKRVLNLGLGSSRVHAIRIHPEEPRRMLAGTDEGLYRSEDGGKTWKRIFLRAEEAEERVLSAAFGRTEGEILAGTARGLFASRDGGVSWTGVPGLEGPVPQVGSGGDALLAVSAGGLYCSTEDLSKWERVYALVGAEAAADEAGNAQLAVEEGPAAPALGGAPALRFAWEKGSAALFLLRGESILSSADGGRTWRETAAALPGAAVREPVAVHTDGPKIYLPTEAGIYLHDVSSRRMDALGWGLPTAGVSDLAYDAGSDTLFAATDRGLFRLPHPETTAFLHAREDRWRRKSEEVLAYFRHEPGILELQEAAVRYAEVHPEKILAWRRGAAVRAWMPELVVGQDRGRDVNVDIDRGGTGDPDQFIIGPPEEDRSLSVDLRWDLADLVWNADQTSIDNRSKLMVQLRDDLLTQLNQLYFARRRLQVESLLAPDVDVKTELERRLRIDEYTAGIDALTGGALSRRLAERAGQPAGEEEHEGP
jgi:photosystem II stability/assembly factor-like uncharacterized protein